VSEKAHLSGIQAGIVKGIKLILDGLNSWKATGAELWHPYFLSLLAEPYGNNERYEEGISLLDQSIGKATKNKDRFYEAELFRLKGELLLSLSDDNRVNAESYFRKAIEVAKSQSAKSLELRAVMSLSRLLQKQGKKEEARKMLSDIYDWFKEGFDTRDLKEAKALLKELS